MSTAMLPGVDRAAMAVALADRLRTAGVEVGASCVETFARALALTGTGSRRALYWTARTTLVRRHADLAAFDAVFAAVFDEAVLGADPHSRRDPRGGTQRGDTHVRLPGQPGASPADGAGLPWATLPAIAGPREDSGEPGSIRLPERLPTDVAAVADTPFDELDPAELVLLGGWLEQALPHWPTRRTRRRRVHPAGTRIALRETIARSRRTGWDPVRLARTRQVRRPRRVVMLCDVSRSMQPYATAYLHLMRAAALATDAEVFAFATSLTRLTAVLAHRSVSVAVEQATARVSDRFGGTRIAANIRALLGSRHGDAVRGAIVVVASDGWDSAPPEQLAAATARLRRRAYRLVWVNPRAAAPGFAPLVGSMAAALPYCDELLPAHTVRALGDVVTAMTR